MRRSLLLIPVSVLLMAAESSPEKLPDWEPMASESTPLTLEPERLVMDLIREGLAPLAEAEAEADVGVARVDNPEVDLIAGGLGGSGLSASEATELARRDTTSGFLAKILATDTALEGRGGVGPWQLFDGEFDESGCRGAAAAGTAAAVAVVCRGLDRRRPRDEHLLVLRGRRIERWPKSVKEGAVPSISADGTRVAVIAAEGGGTLHILDLDEREDLRVGGRWSRATGPRMAARGTKVAFAALLGGDPVAVVVSAGLDVGTVAWRGRKQTAIEGIADDGRLLVRSDPSGPLSVLLVDTTRGLYTDLAVRKGDVEAAVLHPSVDSVVFVTRVGGVCGLFWTDLTTRRRVDLTGTVDGCFSSVDLDDQRRFLLYEKTDSASKTVLLHDRRTGRDWMTLPTGCAEAEISGDGYYVAARCSHDPRGRGIYLFAVPQENPSP